MAKKKKVLELTEEQKKLFNPDYLEKFTPKKEEDKYSGDGRSALNDAWARGETGVTNRNNTI